MLAEFKAKAIHFVVRQIIEKRISPISLEIRETATLDSARDYDQRQGDFRESANHYYSVFLHDQGIEEKADALVGLCQELINLGSFRQVRQLLRDEPLRLLPFLSSRRRIMFEAQCEEKLGWIDDYELGPDNSIQHFNRVVKLLYGIGEGIYTDEKRNLLSTAGHFLGRERFSLARLGVDRKPNTDQAISYFSEGLKSDRLYEGIDRDGKLGFGHAWIARCYMLNGDMTQAQNTIELAGDYFRKQMVVTPQREGYLAHLHLLEGERDLCSGLVQSARKHFLEAVQIRREVELYPKGLVDAYLGLARTYWWRNPILFTRYMSLALQSHPYTLLRGIIGG